jgi:excisionase family DNA binding protein
MSDQVVVPEDLYIVPSEAARILEVSSQDLRQMLENGILKNIRFTPGRHRRYNMKEVLQLKESRRARAAVE